jgi:hypothetical protein
MAAMRRENVLSLGFKMAIVGYLAQIVQDLAVSQPTFERDFDKGFRLISSARRNLRARSYADYAVAMQAKYQRGRALRAVPGQ